jgi:ATP-dependent 26S proteasome regulatory subunit
MGVCLTNLVDAEILKILLRDEMLGDDIDIQSLAKKTESFSGSDLKR